MYDAHMFKMKDARIWEVGVTPNCFDKVYGIIRDARWCTGFGDGEMAGCGEMA